MHNHGWCSLQAAFIENFLVFHGGVIQPDPDTVVAQLLEVGAGRVWDVVDACGQVGLASNVIDKCPPG